MDERNDVAQVDDVSQMSEALAQFIGTAKEVVDRYTHCPECGANLHFTYLTDFSRNLTQESSRCPECGTKPKRLIHKLQ